jgi:hypothetical protein
MKHLLFTIILASIIGCQPAEKKDNEVKASESKDVATSENKINSEFWNRLANLEGQAFEGEVIEAPEGDDFRGKKLVMHVLDVKEDTIYIPFNVGDNLSRTWVLTKTENGIQLKHDHRMEDGSDDDVTMYGGVTANTGFDGLAMFPADQETVDLLPRTATNVWWITVDEEQFTYNLRRIGSTTQFSIGFDLQTPIATPERSWGWEGYEVE